MVKIKKGILAMVIMLLLTICMSIFNQVYATPKTGEAYFGILALMDSKMGYSINAPQNDVGDFARIWNIVQYASGSENTYKENLDIYCLKAGVGSLQAITPSSTPTDKQKVKYDISYDMKKDKEDLGNSSNKYLKDLVNGTIQVDGKEVSKYNALLAAFDMFYNTKEIDKQKLLEAIIQLHPNDDNSEKLQKIIEEGNIDNNEKVITNDEVKAVQQAVLWYFTNNGEKNGLYDKTGTDTSNTWFQYSDTGEIGDYDSLYGYKGKSESDVNIGHLRYYQVDELYKYFIQKAIDNAGNYENLEATENPAKFTKPANGTIGYVAEENNYIFGPICIQKTDSILSNINITVKNGENTIEKSVYSLLDADKQAIKDKEINELIGQDFYISIPKNGLTEVSVEMNISYTTTDVTIWSTKDITTGKEEQPLAIPEVKKHSITEKISVQPKELDLALRKYITKVNGEAVKNTREPVIDKTKLNDKSATTATYKHRKDPVEVETGNIVTYKLTIYNEGGKRGRATKIIDQLPTGLKFEEVVEGGNFEYESYDEKNDNRLVLKRKTGNDTNLEPYTGQENLSEESIEIQCKVTQLAGNDDKILTNVAWISEEKDGETNETITEQKGKDRDSEPSTCPNKNKDNMEDYKGNTENDSELNKPENFYKGEQDDDDFEKIILKKAKGNYKLKLIKVDASNSSTKLQNAKFDVTLNGTSKGSYTTDPNGEIETSVFDITSEGEDTITIQETEVPAGYSKLIDSLTIKIKKALKEGKYEATEATITEGNNNELIKEPTIKDGVIEVTIPNKKIEGNYQLKLMKVDSKEESKMLEGAKFNVTIGEGSPQEYTINSQGFVDTSSIPITGIDLDDTITIEETEAPAGYKKLIETIKLKVTKKVQGDAYKVASVSILEGKGINTPTIDGDVIQVTIPNEKITGSYKLQLVKVDSSNQQTLQGATFSVSLNSGEKKSYTTDGQGEITTSEFEITNTQNDTITIEETGVPSGYSKLINALTIQVTKSIKNGKYEATGATITSGNNDEVITEPTIENGVIEITIPNKKIEGNYQLKLMKVDSKEQSKMLKGAKFNVTIGEGNTQEYTINDQGFVNTSNIPITGTDSDDTITIEETEAPAGYKKLIETIKLKVTKKVQGDAYKVDSVSILEGQGISTPIIDGDVIQVTIPNEKITGSYKLQLVKVDSSNQQTLQGATFSVSLNSGEKKLYTTDGQGEITTSEFEITNTQNDTITIEETGVPSGYSKLIDALTIQVTKTIKDGKYEATGATIISGKNNAVIEEPTIENGVIKIIIPNKKIEGNYGLKLIKVDSNDISNQLEGAKFTVTVGDNQPQQVVTNNEGFVTISNIAINRNWNRYYNNRRN